MMQFNVNRITISSYLRSTYLDLQEGHSDPNLVMFTNLSRGELIY